MNDQTGHTGGGAEGTQSSATTEELLKKLGKATNDPGIVNHIQQALIQLQPRPFHEKITDEQVTKIIDAAEKQDAREHEIKVLSLKNESVHAWRQFLVLIVILGFSGGLIWAFASQPTVLAPILSALLGAGAGFAGGFSLGRKK
jgi:uncharacterized membrane protein